ncbi:MAG TPA: hypothetical protein VGL86_19065 [Polyangia bacterium]|jgi:hypothetical protein
MKTIFVLALAAGLSACATGVKPATGEHTTPATQTSAHNPSMPNLSGEKMPHTTSRDSEARGNPGGIGGGGM